MADQESVNALVEHALLGGDGDLAADAGVLALVGAVAGAVADGQRVAAGLFEKVHRLHGVGVGGGGAEHMVLHAGQHAQLALDGDAVGMGVLDHLAGQLHVVLIGQAAAVDHDAGVAARDAGLDAFQRSAVVQVQRHGDGAFGAVFPDGVAQDLGAFLLVRQAAVHKVGRAAQVGVGGLGPLQDGRRVQQLVDADGRLHLADTVHIESPLAVAVLVRRFQDRAHGYQHGDSSCSIGSKVGCEKRETDL